MKQFFEVCTKVKIVAVELTTLVGFLAVLALVLYFEWHHLVVWASAL